MESGNLNFLEPCGPLQACNGTALPLPLLPTFIVPFCWNSIYQNCGFRKNWYRQSRIFHIGVHDSAFIRVPQHRTAFWRKGRYIKSVQRVTTSTIPNLVTLSYLTYSVQSVHVSIRAGDLMSWQGACRGSCYVHRKRMVLHREGAVPELDFSPFTRVSNYAATFTLIHNSYPLDVRLSCQFPVTLQWLIGLNIL